jgi:hypothetical protein
MFDARRPGKAAKKTALERKNTGRRGFSWYSPEGTKNRFDPKLPPDWAAARRTKVREQKNSRIDHDRGRYGCLESDHQKRS